MTYYIIKPDEDVDLYVLMSSITDTVAMWGKRKQLIRAAKKSKYRALYLGNSIQDRLDRADRMSCDSRVLHWSWDNDQEVGWRGIGWIARSEMKYVIQLLDKGAAVDSEFVEVFVHKFEDDEEDEDEPEEIKLENDLLRSSPLFPIDEDHKTANQRVAEGNI